MTIFATSGSAADRVHVPMKCGVGVLCGGRLGRGETVGIAGVSGQAPAGLGGL
jgi:hypothetical protein